MTGGGREGEEIVQPCVERGWVVEGRKGSGQRGYDGHGRHGRLQMRARE